MRAMRMQDSGLGMSYSQHPEEASFNVFFQVARLELQYPQTIQKQGIHIRQATWTDLLCRVD